MKMLYVGSDTPFNRFTVAAFERAGVSVEFIDDRVNMLVPRFLRKNLFLWQAMRKFSFLKRRSNQRFNAVVRSGIDQFKPDVLFVAKSMIVKPDTLAHAKQRGARTANWFLDNVDHALYKRWFDAHWQDYDIMMSFDSSVADRFHSEKTKTYYVPVAIEPSFFRSIAPSDAERERFACDVCFVGAPYPERIEFLSKLRSQVDLKVFGWNGWQNTPLRDLYGGVLSLEDSIKLYRSSKISLNMNIEPAVKGVNLKTFEIPAAGGFQLTDHRTDLDRLFVEGKEVAVYRSWDEGIEKIHYYLDHEGERQAIIDAGQHRALNEHSFDHRARQILDIIKENASR